MQPLNLLNTLNFIKYLKMSYRVYNFITKKITRSINILLNKEETKLLKFYFVYIKI